MTKHIPLKAIVTGMNGTVAPALASCLKAHGVTVISWDRKSTPIDDAKQVASYIVDQEADWFFHVATGNPLWAKWIAETCQHRGIKLLHTGSVSVFNDTTKAPITVDAPPTATDDYGKYKRECERLVRAACPKAIIARLAWQIGERPGSNNMIDYLTKTMAEKGQVEASSRYYPSVAFLQDTAEALYQLMQNADDVLYHVNGNPKWSFLQIVTALNELHGRAWRIVARDEPQRDNRMLDTRVRVKPIHERLPFLQQLGNG